MSNKRRRYEVFLPARFNDGESVPDEWMAEALNELVEQFDGATFIAEAGEGDRELHEKIPGIQAAFAPGAIQIGILHARMLSVPAHRPYFVEHRIGAFEFADEMNWIIGAREIQIVKRK